MNRQISTIARYTLLEAWQTRLPGLALLATLVLATMALFVSELAVIESGRLRAGFYASGARFAAVFVIMLYVLVSITREFNDKVFDVVLALDLPRAHYILGKLAGFLSIGVLLAAIVSLPVVWLAGPGVALQWGLSLAFELAIVAALSLFCVVTFSHLLPAASFVLAFYLLARSLTAIRLMNAQPLGPADTPAHAVMSWLIEGIALLVPPLDRWTQTSWLVNAAAEWPDILGLGAAAALYVTLLGSATLFDLYRRNF